MVALAGYEPANIFGIVTKQTYSVVVVVPTIMIVDSTMIMESMISVNRDTAPRIPSGNETAPYLIGKFLPPKLSNKGMILPEDGLCLGGSGCSNLLFLRLHFVVLLSLRSCTSVVVNRGPLLDAQFGQPIYWRGKMEMEGEGNTDT